MINPADDGITHINIYSKGKTKLGQWLSNFTFHPIDTEDGRFCSIEGYWYWLSTKDDRLREMGGYKAKQLGRELRGKDWLNDEEFKLKICKAITTKILDKDIYRRMFIESNLPFKHYYVYGDKPVEPKDGQWIIDHIEDLRKQLQGN